MLRSLAFRRFVVLAVGLVAAAALAFGAFRLGSAAGADQTPFPSAVEVTSTTGPSAGLGAPEEPGAASSPASPSAPLTLEKAQAVAVEAAGGGRVVEWDEDTEPTGVQFDVTVLLADGTSTDVTVDAATGRVVSIKHDADQWAID